MRYVTVYRYQTVDKFVYSYGWFGALVERPMQDPSCHANVIVFFTSTLVIASYSLVFTIGHPWRRPFITNCALSASMNALLQTQNASYECL